MTPAAFRREHGCELREWLGWLTGACGPHRWQPSADGAVVELPSGRLRLQWQVLPPRRIASIQLPRLEVAYAFDAAVGEPERAAFMRHFDLYTRRGGG